MSRSKKLLALLLVLALLGAAALLLARRNAKESAAAESPAAEKEELLAFSIDEEEIKSISWSCLSKSGSAFMDGKEWKFKDAAGEVHSADYAKLGPVIRAVSKLPAERCLEDPGDLAQFGFGDPCAKVHIDTADKSFDLVFGDPAKSNQELYYFSCGDGKLYMVKGDITEAFYLRGDELLPVAK